MRLVGSLPWILGALALAGCYETPKPSCVFLCGTGGSCPDGYACSTDDNRCHLVESGGGLAACDDTIPGQIDADTSVDGAPVDASPLDAAPVDASPVDAAPVDAGPDAEPPDALVCAAPLAPTDDPGATNQNLVISEIDPGTHIEVYNNSGASLNLQATAFQLCSPFEYAAIGGASGLGAGIVMPADSYAVLAWPSNFADTDAGGEVILYADSQFGVDASIMDFVCWGTNPHGSRKGQAEDAGKWATLGACAPAITMGAIHRAIGTDGVDAADYTDAAPTPMTCTAQ